MRLAVDGGASQVVLQAAGHIGPAPDEAVGKRPISFAEGDPRFRCPTVIGRPCVLSERLATQIVFTAFDPLDGRRGELARIDADRSRHFFWDLSRDGRWIAFGLCDDTRSVIRLLPLASQPGQAFTVPGWTNLTSVAWAADGRALFATGWASKAPPLLRISLDGRAQLLYKARLYLESPVPPPMDGFLPLEKNSRRATPGFWRAANKQLSRVWMTVLRSGGLAISRPSLKPSTWGSDARFHTPHWHRTATGFFFCTGDVV